MIEQLPEVFAELERLNALPAHLVPDRLRAAVLDTAAAAAAHRQHAEKVAEASAAATSAGQAGDLAAAELAASTLNGLALVGRYVPHAHVDPGAVAEALDGAREAVRVARGDIPPVLAVEYALELAAWHSLGGLPANITGGVPESLGSDLTARAHAEQISAEQKSLAAGIATWNRGQGEVLTLLGTAASFIQQCRELAQRTAAVNAILRQANTDRRAAGLSWRAPDSYSSPACAALKEFRAAESALEVATTP
ncbi:MAG: hypothetical protein ACHQ0J_10505 [Candidatus Dormibacterales bacterium]